MIIIGVTTKKSPILNSIQHKINNINFLHFFFCYLFVKFAYWNSKKDDQNIRKFRLLFFCKIGVKYFKITLSLVSPYKKWKFSRPLIETTDSDSNVVSLVLIRGLELGAEKIFLYPLFFARYALGCYCTPNTNTNNK